MNPLRQTASIARETQESRENANSRKEFSALIDEYKIQVETQAAQNKLLAELKDSIYKSSDYRQYRNDFVADMKIPLENFEDLKHISRYLYSNVLKKQGYAKRLGAFVGLTIDIGPVDANRLMKWANSESGKKFVNSDAQNLDDYVIQQYLLHKKNPKNALLQQYQAKNQENKQLLAVKSKIYETPGYKVLYEQVVNDALGISAEEWQKIKKISVDVWKECDIIGKISSSGLFSLNKGGLVAAVHEEFTPDSQRRAEEYAFDDVFNKRFFRAYKWVNHSKEGKKFLAGGYLNLEDFLIRESLELNR